MALAPLSHRGLRLAAVALLLGATGCDDESSPGPVCTANFAVVTVAVREPDGGPLENASTVATLVRTGEVLAPTSLILLEPGVYAVVDDGHLPKIRPGGDAVRFEASSGPLVATAEFTIRSLGGCHVSKTAGPDTLVANYLED